MPNKLRDYILTAILIIFFALSYILEEYRILVFVLGVIVSVTILLIIFIHIFCYVGTKEINVSLIVSCLIFPFFGTGKYVFFDERFWTNKSLSGDCWTWFLFGIIGLFSLFNLYINRRKFKSFKDKLFNFSLSFLVFTLILFGCFDTYANYAFDLSKAKETECIIVQQLDEGHTLPGYFGHIFIEYEVTTQSDDLVISTLEIPDTNRLQPGDIVKITYREGIFTKSYCTEYDVSMWLPGSLFDQRTQTD